MYITFQQGIVTYPVAGSMQAFLAKTGSYVSLQTTNGQVDIAFDKLICELKSLICRKILQIMSSINFA